MSTREKLLAEIDAFLARTGMEEWRFGQEAAKTHNLVKRLRAGLDVKTSTADMVRAYIAAHRRTRGAPRSRPRSDSALAS